MEIKNFKKNNEIEINNNIANEKNQMEFLDTTLGKTINAAIDIGIRSVLPDFIDEQIINIKDNLILYGLKDGINKTIEDAINLGKSTIGIFTGKFENVSQMQAAVENGGIIDGISKLLDTVVNGAREAGLLNKNIANTIKQGKNIILNNVESNIEKTFKKQYKNFEYIDKYINNWKEYFEKKDFSGMEKEYKKIEIKLNEIAPIEKTINEAKQIGIIHNLIKNNGENFNLSSEQLELAEKLI